MMKQVYGDDCLSRTQVNEWFKRFQEGREDILDHEHPGPLKTVATENCLQSKRYEPLQKLAAIVESQFYPLLRIISTNEPKKLHNLT
ncbi:hypothetical protein ILUMI_26325 [Ignelater luminosus]|uniref:Mos1 transposase HTH domain-containing protein n=1 Tax=Ignelater luminosus TaxID=2038154 RepID=A0A8K0FYS3_IGNLU|nr:hypothetical protein ILUMI_26325 [Ignelater luminosus]